MNLGTSSAPHACEAQSCTQRGAHATKISPCMEIRSSERNASCRFARPLPQLRRKYPARSLHFFQLADGISVKAFGEP